ncbi:YbaB/EbfC family nucleoid-associated protein [Glycomyces sp. TRM65418]|uniref:YbaB/EbfC family nucleoid-associated protein n=1 Tax=Glycomyces sp. TRM65418 TaxID=2867006 RepID=UPI001CE4BA34|nr:YbaB/EbfC family nucleoid-associated protein [Glycomyces sp. TRM65418]MCC3764217.1 YbaB/EbfC family nucleoid-associated protein [Glycomyces sp. TRM65418]QZD53900.1 YbaB/EbfC family nucleoid-associated protein [Glycomyces sp. TRM65418]
MDDPTGDEQRPGRERPSALTDPEGYMRDFQNRVAVIRERAERVQDLMNDTNVRLESEEGEVAVTVNIGGGLVDLEIRPVTRTMSGPAIAAMILETYQRAAAEASRRSVDVMSEMLGDDSEAMSMIRQSINRHAPRED